MRHGGRQAACSFAAVLAGLLAPAALFAQTPPPSAPAAKLPEPPPPAEVHIAPDAGYVLETRRPAAPAPDAPLIIHIQEAHTNEEAQRHMISMLDELVKRYGLRLIMVEGGQGNVSLSYMRHLGSPENRRDVAEKYLKLGLISAEEYLDIVSEYPLTLWGVEQTDLYDEHVRVFLEAEALQPRCTPLLAAVRQAVDRLTPSVFDPALNEFNAQAEAFESGHATLAEFTVTLETLAQGHGVDLASYPQVRLFRQIVQLERQPAERQQYEALSKDLKPLDLAAEIDRLTSQLRRILAGTPEAARLQTIAQQLGLVEKLVAAKLSPDEYQQAERIGPQDILAWAQATGVDGLSGLAAVLPVFRRFYEVAQARDAVLVEHALAKLRQEQVGLAVLITGGFHGPQLAQRLTEQGVSVMAVVPKVTQATDDRLYRAVLKYKSGHGALADVEHAASSTR